MSVVSHLVKGVSELNTSLGARFYYKLQCDHIAFGWCDWMPNNTLMRHTFIEDARTEIERNEKVGVPQGAKSWRIVFVAEVYEVVENK